MKILHFRLDNNQVEESCRGLIYIDENPFCFVMEDLVRTHKIPGRTAIDAGTYVMGWREEKTEKTLAYQKKYPKWFKWHIHLKDVPNYSGIYDHIGNYPGDSEGCRLMASNWMWDDPGMIGRSTPVFEEYYKIVGGALNAGEPVTTTIINLFEQAGQIVVPLPQT